MKGVSRNIRLLVLFILVITGLSLVYDYPETLLKRPQSIHNWRQCDGASLALNYYQEGMHFFKPQTHMLYSDDYTTGYAAPSEFPILYYFVAILYKIFGYHEYIFRGLNLLIFFIGLFYLFKLSDAILHNLFYSIIVVVLMFSSPVLVYYGNNFLPNTVALSFSIIAWYYFYRYSRDKSTKTFLVSMLFFGIAASLKITELTGPIIIVILFLSEQFRITDLNLKFRHRMGIKMTSMLAIFVVVAGWVLYAKYYNNLHNSWQFATYTVPIWGIGTEDIKMVLHNMKVLWFKDYFFPPTFYFMVASLLLSIFSKKRSERIISRVAYFYVAALIAFSLLWFHTLGDHDYFYIGFYVLPAVLFINFFYILKGFHFQKLYSGIIAVVFMVVAVINVYYARGQHSLRYHSWVNDYDQTADMYTIKPWLQENGITRNDTMIFYPSRYIRPLYLMNLKGWTIFNHELVITPIEKRDSMLMKIFVENGAEYFMTNDLESALAYKPFESYMKDLFGKYNDIYVFRVPPRQVNFNPADSAMWNPPK
jgi:hypothetical protein